MTLPTTTASRIATDQPRKCSILEPPLAPVPEPYATSANALMSMSLAPRSNAATLIRPLVLPSPPTSPTTLTTPVPAHVPTRPLCCNLDQQHESPSGSLWRQRTLPHETFARSGTAEYLSNVRKLDTLPMFRFSDLCNVHESAVAQSYVIDRLHTPGLAPYSIAAMLNEPEFPDPPPTNAGMSKQESSDNSQRDDGAEMGVRPLSALPTPTHQPVPSNSPTCDNAKGKHIQEKMSISARGELRHGTEAGYESDRKV
ncbi:hypothetical protein CKM354_000400000 [Cercospora kikuchii]|uniref:Uncharacterized protein n=1 Tax=Cercospora kikuchii TaxID=84275 RepID=A0A9P3CF72_9PEZI|nr:uncharacterized protein CKM354_000400000 [Cercospora kikuchii]GIZ40671.1 hypothetical protein CKM354_000400000 [Cercospora kikuchii]